jgi:hypothetical protein
MLAVHRPDAAPEASPFPRLLGAKPIAETVPIDLQGVPGMVVAYTAEQWARWGGHKPPGFALVADVWMKILVAG